MKRIFYPMAITVLLLAFGQLQAGTSLLILENGSGKSVKSRPIAKTLKISKQIDQLVMQGLEKKNLQPNRRASDEVFLRRAYLDIAGRIPSYDETVRFLKDPSIRKRQHLIDLLLDSDGFESHQFNFFADLLRLKSRMRNVTGQPYIDFVKNAIATNKPFDQFVRELINAEGDYAQRGRGAVGYYLRDFDMPEDNMSNTIRIFLGTRLECAQCHDHPFDVWTQKDYFEMVAFTGGIMTRIQPPFQDPAEIKQMQRKGNLPEESRRNLTRMLRPLSYGVRGSGTGLARLPEDYQESDGEANQIVSAKTMFEKKKLVVPVLPSVNHKKNKRPASKRNGSQIRGAKHIESRQAYAQWMTSKENPRFATVIANRLWKRVMGVGLIEPVDIITSETVPSNPELMSFLTQQMIDMDFDLKQFMRAIYNSQTYQRTACISDTEEITEYSFRGPLLRRLSGEQLWDSLMTLAVENIDERKAIVGSGNYQGINIHTLYEKAKGMTAKEFLELANTPRDELRKKLSESSESSYKSRNISQEVQRKYAVQIRKLQKEMADARRANDAKSLKKLQRQYKTLTTKNRTAKSKSARDLIRASEMSSPAKAGHLVREFGQSDREEIDNSNKEPAVTQVLSLMNGFIETRIAANPNTQLMINAGKSDRLETKIETVFLSILNRYPDSREKQTWMKEAITNGKTVAADLIWTLVNNSEFLFIQ